MNNSKLYNLVLRFLIRVLGVMLIIIGLPFFPVGGFILVILGVLCFRLAKTWKKQLASNDTQVIQEPIPTPSITINQSPIEEVERKEKEDDTKIETHKVAGVSYREDDIISLGLENEDYNYSKKELVDLGYEDERIYQYEFYPNKVELIPEPDNPYDSNAVKVVVDNVHVGYIKSGSCRHILNLLKDDRIIKIECEIGGGKYKRLEYDLYEDKYNLEKLESQIFVHLKISVK